MNVISITGKILAYFLLQYIHKIYSKTLKFFKNIKYHIIEISSYSNFYFDDLTRWL